MANDKVGRPGFRPLHPGTVLRHDLEALGMSQEAFAEHIGVTRQTVNAIIAGRSSLTAETAAKVARAIGGSTQFWMNMQTAHDAWDAERRPGLSRIKRIKAAPSVFAKSALSGQFAKPGASLRKVALPGEQRAAGRGSLKPGAR